MRIRDGVLGRTATIAIGGYREALSNTGWVGDAPDGYVGSGVGVRKPENVRTCSACNASGTAAYQQMVGLARIPRWKPRLR